MLSSFLRSRMGERSTAIGIALLITSAVEAYLTGGSGTVLPTILGGLAAILTPDKKALE